MRVLIVDDQVLFGEGLANLLSAQSDFVVVGLAGSVSEAIAIARERKPEPHHARVIVNAAKTVATFLVESYLFQREKGLPPMPRVAEGGGR